MVGCGGVAALAAAIESKCVLLRLMNKPEKSTLPSNLPIGGMIRSSTSEDTTLPKATAIITPTAKSKTLPRMANSLNSLSTVFLLCFFDEGKRRPGADSQTLIGLSVTGIIVAAGEKERREDGGARVRARRPFWRCFFSWAG